MTKKLLLTTFLLTSITLAGCQIPFTDIVVTIPFIEKSPKTLLEETSAKMAQLDSVHYDARFVYEGNELPLAKTVARLYGIPTDLLGKLPTSQSVIMDMKVAGDMNFAETYQMGSQYSTVININGHDGTITGKTITSGDKVYMKVESLPQLTVLALNEALLDKWIQITNLQSGVIGSTLTDIKNDLLNKKEQAASGENDIDQLIKILSTGKMGKRLPDEKVNSLETYHYQIELTAESMSQMLAIYSGAAGNPAGGSQYQNYIQQLDQGTAELWVGKKDSYLYKFRVAGEGKSASDPLATVTFDLENTFSKFNQRVVIEEPTDAVSADQFLSTVSSSETGSIRQTILDNLLQTTPSDTDNDDLNDSEETTYNTNSNNPDTDGDGFQDGKEVQNGFNPNGAGKL